MNVFCLVLARALPTYARKARGRLGWYFVTMSTKLRVVLAFSIKLQMMLFSGSKKGITRINCNCRRRGNKPQILLLRHFGNMSSSVTVSEFVLKMRGNLYVQEFYHFRVYFQPFLPTRALHFRKKILSYGLLRL